MHMYHVGYHFGRCCIAVHLQLYHLMHLLFINELNTVRGSGLVSIGINPGSWGRDPRFWGEGHGVFMKYYYIL